MNMPQFYNRYVPPPGNNAVPAKTHDDKEDENDTSNLKKRKRSSSDSGKTQKSNTSQTPEKEHAGKAVLDKYSTAKFAASQDKEASITFREESSRKKDKASKSRTVVETVVPNDEAHGSLAEEAQVQQIQDSKHSDLFSRFHKSRKLSQKRGPANEEPNNSTDQLDTRDLVPIPQPEPKATKDFIQNFSTQPVWQSRATNVENVEVKFESLGLSEHIITNLKTDGIESTFPIQSAVIPRLLRRSNRDLCVSAATGSGKTLAYVVPIIEHLRKDGKHGLRVVIVVPTRELVKQVREVSELCAVGSSLKIATAVGSKSLQEEQRHLVEEIEVYDPVAYEEDLNKRVDWMSFSLVKQLKRAREIDMIESTHYKTKTRLKADVLITTPGRLVDHLQNTDGFHLDDVQWLVVDEADRLLGESYQEWIDTVVPALQSRNSTRETDEILAHMRIQPAPRVVRKVLLSATMTQDISRLNSIGLVNPELIVLGAFDKPGEHKLEAETKERSDNAYINDRSEFHLPPSLREVAVTLKHDTEKPLVLFEILIKHMGMQEHVTDESEASDSSSQSSESSVAVDSDNTVDRANPRVLIFSRSTASANRLARLLSIISSSLESRIATLTRSTASSASSRKALSAFKNRKTTILIATDRASRGIDVPDLENVLNYDIPGSAATYVHRVGRTARAGKAGQAWTLVEHREGRWFWSEIGGKGDDSKVRRSGKIRKMDIHIDDEGLKERYEQALQTLGAEVRQD